MKRLFISACIIVGCVLGIQAAVAQVEMEKDGLTVVWQHDEDNAQGRSGNWSSTNWRRANSVFNDLRAPAAKYNSYISGFDTKATVTIPGGTTAVANQLFLVTSNATDADGPLTLDIKGNANFASIQAVSYSSDGGNGIVINHTGGTVKLAGSTWSGAAAGSGRMGTLGYGAMDNSTAKWEAWPYTTYADGEPLYVAWDSAAMSYPLFITGWGSASYYNIFDEATKNYMAASFTETGEDLYDLWWSNSFRNPLVSDTTGWTGTGLKNADTPEMFKRNNDKIPSDTELKDRNYLLKNDGGELYLIHNSEGDVNWDFDGAPGDVVPFGRLALDPYDGGDPGPDPDDPARDNTPAPSLLKLGVSGPENPTEAPDLKATYVLGEQGKKDAVLQVDRIEILGNGRNKFDAQGGILEAKEIIFDGGTATIPNRDDMTFFNDGTEIRFTHAKPAGEGNLLTVAGNYSGIGRTANNGALNMRAYDVAENGVVYNRDKVDFKADGDGIFHVDKDGNIVLATATDAAASYVLFDSDMMKISFAGSEETTGILITGGKLILDVTAIKDFYSDFADSTDGVALRLFDAEGDIIKGAGTNSDYFHNVKLVGAASDGSPLVEFLGDAVLGPNAAGDTFVHALANQYMMDDGVFLLGWGTAPQGGDDGNGVPEPSTVVLMLLGVAGLYFARKRRA